MNRMMLIAILIFVSNLSHGEGKEWEFHSEKNGVSLYLRDYPNSRIPEFRAATTIESTIASVLAVLLDTSACSKWVHQCKEAFSLEVINPSEQYIYQVNELPLVKDRDIILHATLSYWDGGDKIRINLNASSDFCDAKNKDDQENNCDGINPDKYIHITKAIGHYELQKTETGTQVIWQQHLDPAGSLPHWLAKSQLANLPLKSLASLNKIVQQKKYQQASLVFDNDRMQVTYTQKNTVVMVQNFNLTGSKNDQPSN